MLRPSLASVLVLLITLSCGSGNEPGTFSMSFSWDTPPANQVWFWVRVEERTNQTQPGKILASAGPEAYTHGEGLSLVLDNVPNGDNRYIVAEVREGSNSGLPILYYGLSESFSLQPGSHKQIQVPMSLQVPEALSVTASVNLEFSGMDLDQVGKAQLADTTVVTRSMHAKTVVLANNAGFSINVREIAIESLGDVNCITEKDGDQSWDICTILHWNLAEGLGDELTDGQYTLFAKFIDQFGYESDVYRDSVVLDSDGPLLLLGSLTPPIARPGTDVYINLAFHETVGSDKGSLVLTPHPDLPPGVILSAPERVGTSTSYLWFLTLPEQWDATTNEYTFSVLAKDMLGNPSDSQPVTDQDGIPIALHVDPTPPMLMPDVGLNYSQSTFGLADSKAELTFDFAIMEENPPAFSAVEDNHCAGLCPAVKTGSFNLGYVELNPTLDNPDENLFGFRFAGLVDITEIGATEVVIHPVISWADAAGNPMEVQLDDGLTIDFKAPDILSCSLAPSFGNASAVFTYSITATEPLETQPELQIDSPDDIFTAAATPSAEGRTWQWQQPGTNLSNQSFTLSARLTDAAGNTSQSEDDGFLCYQTASLDGTAPVLETETSEPLLWTNPVVEDGSGVSQLMCGDSYTLHVSFTVTEQGLLAEGYPEVRLAVPGVKLDLEETSKEQLNDTQWSFEYSITLSALEHFDAQGLWPVRITLRDHAGNESVVDSLGDSLITVDFTPPSAECSLFPVLGNVPYGIGSKVLLKVFPLEQLPVEYVPDIHEQFIPDFNEEFFSFDDYDQTSYRFSHVVQEDDGEHTFQVNLSLVDLVGNATPAESTACIGGLLTGSFDGLAPTVTDVSLALDPPEADWQSIPLKAGRTVVAQIDVANTIIEPLVLLGQGLMTAVSGPEITGEDTVSWTFSLTLTGLEGDGWIPVTVTTNDPAGNKSTYSHDEMPLQLDFVPPLVQCSMFPLNASLNDTVVVTVNVSEPPDGGGPLVTSEGISFPAPEVSDDSLSYTYKHAIDTEDATVTDWSYMVSVCDKAGNCSDESACSGSGIIDAQAPVIDNGWIGTAPVVTTSAGATIVAGGDTDQVLVSFTVTENQSLADGYPEVILDTTSGPVSFTLVALTPVGLDDGAFEAEYELTLDFIQHQEAQGSWPVRVTAADVAGNISTVSPLSGQYVTVDFTPPTALCSLIPDSTEKPYAIGQQVLLVVSPVEELSHEIQPTLTETFEPSLAQPFFSLVADTEYRFAGEFTDLGKEGSFTIEVGLTDLVGNTTPADGNACETPLVKISFDALEPALEAPDVTVDDGQVSADGALRAGREIGLTFTTLNTANMPSVTLGGKPFTKSDGPTVAGIDDAWNWKFSRVLDGSEGEGSKTIRVSGSDDAGNDFMADVTEFPLLLDFTDPIANCFVNLPEASAGDEVKLTITTSESMNNSPDLSSEIDWLYNDDASQPEGSPPLFIYTHKVLVGDNKTEWTATVQGEDLAGNPDPSVPLCEVSGQTDGIAITISDHDFHAQYEDPDQPGVFIDTTTYARADAQVIIDFTVSDLPVEDSLVVKVGNDVVTDFELSSKTYTFTYSIEGKGESGTVVPVTVSLADDAGNDSFATLGTLWLDFDAPGLASPPYLSRCDNLSTARIADDEIRVFHGLLNNGNWDCMYGGPGSACDKEGDAYGQVQVAFSLTEPAVENSITVSMDGITWSIDPCNSTSSHVTALYQTTGNEDQTGCRPILTQVRDMAGNSASLEGGCIHFDFTPPSPPKVNDSRQVVYTRIPWGSARSGKESRLFAISGKAGSVEPDTRIMVWDSLETGTAGKIGSFALHEDDSWGCIEDDPYNCDSSNGLLNPVDRPMIFVSTVDQAGNQSDLDENPSNGLQASLVRDVDWVATMGSKVAGSFVENPHVLESTTWFQPWRLQNDTVELGKNSNATLEADASLIVEGADFRWEQVAPYPFVPAWRKYTSMVLESRTGRLIAFGGTGGDNSALRGDTLAFDGIKWTQLAVPDPEGDGNPSARYGHAMVFDEIRDEVFLFGGADPQSKNDNWVFDGTSWRKVMPLDPESDGNPSGRYHHAMAYDKLRGITVLYGGFMNKSDTWEWNGESWHSISVADPENDGNPGKREEHCMAFDPVREVTILFGGGLSNHVWEWNGESWLRVIPLDPEGDGSPTPLWGCAMTFDHDADEIVMFGGSYGNTFYGDTWRWDGVSWDRLDKGWISASTDPWPRYGHGMAWHPMLNSPVIFAGHIKFQSSDWGARYDTWYWDAGDWIQVGPRTSAAGSPEGPRMTHLTYDPQRKVAVMYGGAGKDGSGEYLSDTWEWDGLAWDQPDISDPENDGNPPALFGGTAQYMNSLGRTVIFAGRKPTGNGWANTNEMWLWSGSSWQRFKYTDSYPYDGHPIPHGFSGMALDYYRNYLVHFGGDATNFDLGMTWEFRSGSNDWIRRTPYDPEGDGNPASRWGNGLAYDKLRKYSLLYGGKAKQGSTYGDTWRWNGQTWMRFDPQDPEGDGNPTPRSLFAMTYDSHRQRVVIFGGDNGGYLGDLWSWTGSSWDFATVADPLGDGAPAPKANAAMVYYDTHDRLLLTGGENFAEKSWYGQWSTGERPAQVWQIDFSASANCTTPHFEEVTVDWAAGGEGYNDNEVGGRLLAWDAGQWALVAQDNSASVNDPAVLSWSTVDPLQLERLFVSDNQVLSLAVTPLSFTANKTAVVTGDWCEAKVKYRLPVDTLDLCD